ncbi:glycoside hydrolase family 30 protein [Desertivirga xinjiangensis]|uniref:glycoside hydrolase family 30 protein n=1 Tax=Desertivirga xinjiangensis TaxID=539206 RepID=UPI00210B303A|nr:glycoside hydrolase family 30 protein [Pedobacter xinjiangensis]
MKKENSRRQALKNIIKGPATLGAAFFLLLIVCNTQLRGQERSGKYRLKTDQPQQVIWGLGVEIQNDAIGSGNTGLPEEVIAIPNNLVDAERERFYRDLLKGFRYCRLAMGLYFRGLDSTKSRMVERYPGQLKDLKELIVKSGIEGISMEYWSPAPYWKSTNSYLGGSLKQYNQSFLNDFGNALRDDILYLKKEGLKISMWGLQNEPSIKTLGNLTLGKAPQAYSHCYYPADMYCKVLKKVAPKIKEAAPEALIMAETWNGNSGEIGKQIQTDPTLLSYVDAWVYHRVGSNSNQIIRESELYKTNTFVKPVYQNEFEYQRPTSDTLCINRAQNLMNWLVFVNSPTWFWLHALKPTTNAEASGYCLGFWRPENDNDFSKFSGIRKGHWQYNSQNFNALAGFLKYMPWNSVRYNVEEDKVRDDNRILAFKTPGGQMTIVLTNRSGAPFTFQIKTGSSKTFKGYRYTPTSRNVYIADLPGQSFKTTLPDLSIEFWIESAD